MSASSYELEHCVCLPIFRVYHQNYMEFLSLKIRKFVFLQIRASYAPNNCRNARAKHSHSHAVLVDSVRPDDNNGCL